jgi:hypothetical protein
MARTDMIKMYAPPLKTHQMPFNNPFYSKNFKEGDGGLDEFEHEKACFNIMKAKFGCGKKKDESTASTAGEETATQSIVNGY